jgi:type II restriction/modification system DNA methylase subunit YeeA
VTAAEFARKWLGSTQSERAAAQEHFLDLCALLEVETPNADPSGADYAFEKGAEKSGGGEGFADVWRRGYFAWEYKRKNRSLRAAYQQLLQYREALENPPLLVVCNLDKFEIHTNFTNTPSTVYEFDLEEMLRAPERPMRLLRSLMRSPSDLRPDSTRDEITEQAAAQFASLAFGLRERGHESHAVAHFLNKLLFCLFAEDAELLPSRLLRRLAQGTRHDSDRFASALRELFGKMSHRGGMFGSERIEWFNGGLFDGPDVLSLTSDEIAVVERASALDWSQVEPAIFGSLFERGLDPDKRSQLGAHYTDRDSILRVVLPVVIDPLRREFEAMQERVVELLAAGRRVTSRTRADRNPLAVFNSFLDRLSAITVFDPACGSGNFLYVTLQQLKDLEREAILWGSLTLKITMPFPRVSPRQLKGIELNPYAAELARVVIWIGEIQWMLANGFAYLREPILRPLNNIECRDAILDRTAQDTATEPTWPAADFIVGNPPWLGGKFQRRSLGDEYVDAMFRVYKGRVPAEADLVLYWFEKARQLIEQKQVRRVGLLATQGIRGGANRRVVEQIKCSGDIFAAWSDEEWIVEGAHVHSSFIGFDDGSESARVLNSIPVSTINADLTAGLDLTKAPRLAENREIAFMGDTKGGPFDVDRETASALIAAPTPDGRSSEDVVRPWVVTNDITLVHRRMWIIDFPPGTSEAEAALWEAPFEFLKERVEAVNGNRREIYTTKWWIHTRPRPAMRAALAPLRRFIATPTTSKHRIFVWLSGATLPDHQLIVFARSDDYYFGVLHSRLHELWARRLGTQLRDSRSGFRYTPTTTFETFPFPRAGESQQAAIAQAAKRLDELRRGWVDADGLSAAERRIRTLTRLYNEAPTWLTQAHARLDGAVLDAYGWHRGMTDQELLEQLAALAMERASRESNQFA